MSEQVYKGTYTPLYSYVPDGLTGATESLKGLYGDGDGGPDADKAKATLEAPASPSRSRSASSTRTTTTVRRRPTSTR